MESVRSRRRCVLSGNAAGIILLLAVTGAAFAGPRITVDQPVFNFGCITNVSQMAHDFIIHNEGDADLEISRVVSGCDACLRAVLEKPKIPPGGRATLHCQLDVRLLCGDVSRAISLYSNDPDNAMMVLVLEGAVVPLYRVVPPGIMINGFPDQRTETLEITPLQKLRGPLSLAICDNTNITARISQVQPDRFLLTVQVLDSLPRGRSMINVTLRSADSNDPPCLIQGSAYYPPDYEVIPAQLIFDARDEPQMRILWLKQHGQARLILLDAIPSSGEFRCEIDPDPVSADYRIYVTTQHQERSAGGTQRLILKTIDQSQREVVIPVTISVEDVGRATR